MNPGPRSARKKVAKKPSATNRDIAPKLKLWVVFDERVKFGDGRAQLLELIDQLGSIKNAVKAWAVTVLHGDTSRSWKKQQALNSWSANPDAGRRGSGAQLTSEAKTFLLHLPRVPTQRAAAGQSAFHRAFNPSDLLAFMLFEKKKKAYNCSGSAVCAQFRSSCSHRGATTVSRFQDAQQDAWRIRRVLANWLAVNFFVVVILATASSAATNSVILATTTSTQDWDCLTFWFRY